jgi:hypothetical protein
MIKNRETMKTSGKMNGALVGLTLMFCLICSIACDTDAIYKEEQYKHLVYLLSGTNNIYTESYTLNEQEPVKYFSIGIGGSTPNEREIMVTLEPDRVLLDRYNRNNFDFEESYAKVLPAERYEIGSYVVTVPALPADQYVRVPVKVNPHGLSPDSIYFLPLAINSVSTYDVNEAKFTMLYRVSIEIGYAQQAVATYYIKRGRVETGNIELGMSGTKLVQPLSNDKVRMFAGNLNQSLSTTTLAQIDSSAIVVRIQEDNTLEITPYGSKIEVEMIHLQDDVETYNIYNPEVRQGTRILRVFYLHYRYRTVRNGGVYSPWSEVRETLTRIEED